MQTERVTYLTSAEHKAALEAFAKARGESVGNVVREATTSYMAEMPLEDDALQGLNRRLGRRFDIALLFTWVAGLLNLLAVWDAFEGPAYGYGDEVEQPETEESKPANKLEPASAPVAAAKTVAVMGSATSPA